LANNAAAINWIRDAFGHLKVIGHSPEAASLFAKAGIADSLDDGVIALATPAAVKRFVDAAKKQRVWEREFRLAAAAE
jgi:catalase